MSHYGDFYREREESSIIDAFLPKWAKTEDRHVQVALAEGYKAKAELAKLKTALKQLKDVI